MSQVERIGRIERGEQIVVGVNKYLETEPSPLTGGIDSIMTVSEDAERDQLERLAQGLDVSSQNAEAVSRGLFAQYLLPFEILSVILLVALVGAVVLAKTERV